MTLRDTRAGPLPEAIVAAVKRLNERRESGPNPAERGERVAEAVPGFPDRIVPKPEHAAVAAAYGWADCRPDMPDEEILRRLLAPNRERSGSPA